MAVILLSLAQQYFVLIGRDLYHQHGCLHRGRGELGLCSWLWLTNLVTKNTLEGLSLLKCQDSHVTCDYKANNIEGYNIST